MIPLPSVLDHILSKRLDGQQQQQQQWQSIKINSNTKKPKSNKFTVLLDKHIAQANYNYFTPLSLPSNSVTTTLSAAFPTIMPSLHFPPINVPPASTLTTPTKSVPKKKKQISTEKMYQKSGKSSDSEAGSNKSPVKSKAKRSTVPDVSVPTVAPSGDPKASTTLQSDDKHDNAQRSGASLSEKLVVNRRKHHARPATDSSFGKDSDDDDDSAFGKEEWDIPKHKRSNTKEHWDSDSSDSSSDSDFKVSKAVDKAIAKGQAGKSKQRSSRAGRDTGRGNRRGERSFGRGGGGGRGGGRGSSASDKDCDDEIITKSTHDTRKEASDHHTDDYTDEEAGVVPVANGAKRRKGVAIHRKRRDKIMADAAADPDTDIPADDTNNDATMEHDDNEADVTEHNQGILDNADADVAPEDDIANDNDGDDAGNDDGDDDDNDSDIMMVKVKAAKESDDEHENDTDSDDGPPDLVPTYDTKWLFEFQPKEKIERFTIDSIVGCLATAVRSVDSTAYITSWDNLSTEHIWSEATVPTTDEAMTHFVEDPHTSTVGGGRLYGRIRLITSMTLMEIKLNPEFGAWIRSQGLFLDVSDIPCTRPKLIGFFDRKLPHTSRIDIFKEYLHATTQFSKPFQIYSQTINAGDNTDLKCYAYVLKADAQDAEILLQELHSFKANNSVKFYSWDDFRDHTDLKDKRKIIQDMTDYARNHASFVFSGIKDNNYMRLTKNKRSTGSKAASKQLSSLQQTYVDEENQKDTEFSNVRCLDFMQQFFVDSDKQQIFKRIDGPYNGKIEVTFSKSYFNQVRDIEKRFINILSAKMTDLSKVTCFSPWPIPLTPESMTSAWTPPKAFKRYGTSTTGQQTGQPYRKTGTIEFSLTSSSALSYIEAATLGRRQIDIPKTLVVTSVTATSPNPPSTPATASTLDTTLASSQGSILLAEMQEAQQLFQKQYDTRLATLDATIIRVEKESKAIRETLSNLSIEVNKKYTEIQTSQSTSESRITAALKKQRTSQKKEAARTKKMMTKILLRLGGDDDTDDPDTDDEDDTDIMKQAKPGSSRTNHPEDANNPIIHPSSRNNSRVAATVK